MSPDIGLHNTRPVAFFMLKNAKCDIASGLTQQNDEWQLLVYLGPLRDEILMKQAVLFDRSFVCLSVCVCVWQ